MPSLASLSNDDLAFCSFLLPLTVVLMLPGSAFAVAQDNSTESSKTISSTQIASPIIKSLNQELKPREPVETPPTEYLPYPPPPNYSWPAGMTPQNENPQPSEFNPPTGWYTGQSGSSGSGSGASGAYQSAASASLRPNALFRLLASAIATDARRVPQPRAAPQLASQYAPLLSNERPPGAVPTFEHSHQTTEIIPPTSWPLLTRLLISILPAHARSAELPRILIETPPTEYLPYPPPPNFDWPADSTLRNENPQFSEFDPSTASPETSGLIAGSGKHAALDAGAIAGIVIGGVVALLLMVWWVWRKQNVKRRQKKADAKSGDGGGAQPTPPMSEHDE